MSLVGVVLVAYNRNTGYRTVFRYPPPGAPVYPPESTVDERLELAASAAAVDAFNRLSAGVLAKLFMHKAAIAGGQFEIVLDELRFVTHEVGSTYENWDEDEIAEEYTEYDEGIYDEVLDSEEDEEQAYLLGAGGVLPEGALAAALAVRKLPASADDDTVPSPAEPVDAANASASVAATPNGGTSSGGAGGSADVGGGGDDGGGGGGGAVDGSGGSGGGGGGGGGSGGATATPQSLAMFRVIFCLREFSGASPGERVATTALRRGVSEVATRLCECMELEERRAHYVSDSATILLGIWEDMSWAKQRQMEAAAVTVRTPFGRGAQALADREKFIDVALQHSSLACTLRDICHALQLRERHLASRSSGAGGSQVLLGTLPPTRVLVNGWLAVPINLPPAAAAAGNSNAATLSSVVAAAAPLVAAPTAPLSASTPPSSPRPIRPYQTVLLRADAHSILSELQADVGAGGSLQLRSFLKELSPLRSLRQVHLATGIPLSQVVRLAAHATRWGLGMLIDTVTEKSRFGIPAMPPPQVPKSFSTTAASFSSSFAAGAFDGSRKSSTRGGGAESHSSLAFRLQFNPTLMALQAEADSKATAAEDAKRKAQQQLLQAAQAAEQLMQLDSDRSMPQALAVRQPRSATAQDLVARRSSGASLEGEDDLRDHSYAPAAAPRRGAPPRRPSSFATGNSNALPNGLSRPDLVRGSSGGSCDGGSSSRKARRPRTGSLGSEPDARALTDDDEEEHASREDAEEEEVFQLEEQQRASPPRALRATPPSPPPAALPPPSPQEPWMVTPGSDADRGVQVVQGPGSPGSSTAGSSYGREPGSWGAAAASGVRMRRRDGSADDLARRRRRQQQQQQQQQQPQQQQQQQQPAEAQQVGLSRSWNQHSRLERSASDGRSEVRAARRESTTRQSEREAQRRGNGRGGVGRSNLAHLTAQQVEEKKTADRKLRLRKRPIGRLLYGGLAAALEMLSSGSQPAQQQQSAGADQTPVSKRHAQGAKVRNMSHSSGVRAVPGPTTLSSVIALGESEVEKQLLLDVTVWLLQRGLIAQVHQVSLTAACCHACAPPLFTNPPCPSPTSSSICSCHKKSGASAKPSANVHSAPD
jgi:hypothetical protein